MARRIRSSSITTGRNAEHPSYSDRRYVRCKNCGYVCNLDRDIKAPRGSHMGDGLDHTSTYTTSGLGYGLDAWGSSGWGDSTVTRYDVTVNNGCPFCGTLLYYE